jgi:transcriptional regulator with XRE-family HTH domain
MGGSARTTFGATIRTTRRSRGWTQAELGRRARTAQSVVAAVEAGAGASIESLERICAAFDGSLILGVRLPFSGDPVRQVDLGHARCVGSMRRLLEVAGHVCVTEQEIVDGPWRGWIDLVAYDPARRRIVIGEIKTELRDAGALERQVERYVRSSLSVARERGWVVEEIVVVVVVLATAANDAFLVANRNLMKGAFPVRGRVAVAALLDRAAAPGRMLVMLDPRRRGRRAIVRSVADGRRTAAPYRDYGAFAAIIR